MILRQAVLHDKLLDADQMAVFVWDGRESEMVYNHGYSLVSYIARTYGTEKIPAMMRAMGSANRRYIRYGLPGCAEEIPKGTLPGMDRLA